MNHVQLILCDISLLLSLLLGRVVLLARCSHQNTLRECKKNKKTLFSYRESWKATGAGQIAPILPVCKVDGEFFLPHTYTHLIKQYL